jgi:carbon-monoxide dehydrogenase small subunit
LRCLLKAQGGYVRGLGSGSNRLAGELSGNLCRCTGYVGLVRAVQRVLAARRQV